MLVNENYRVPDDTKSFFFSPKTEAYTYSYRFNILVSLDSGDLNISYRINSKWMWKVFLLRLTTITYCLYQNYGKILHKRPN